MAESSVSAVKKVVEEFRRLGAWTDTPSLPDYPINGRPAPATPAQMGCIPGMKYKVIAVNGTDLEQIRRGKKEKPKR